MDLVSTVRKEGSRGGRGDFKWEDVKTSQHRENYLGHSVMAPVGRWQQGKDLQWYSRTKDQDGEEMTEEEKKKAEFLMVKKAEADAIAKVLGYEPMPLAADGVPGNPNDVAIGERRRKSHDEVSSKGRRRRSRSRERDHESRRHHRHHHSSRGDVRDRDRASFHRDSHRRHRSPRDDRREQRKRSRSRDYERKSGNDRGNSGRSRVDSSRRRSRSPISRDDRHHRRHH